MTDSKRARRPKREPTSATVRAALACVPASIDREAWVRVAMSIKSFFGADGFDLFDTWSREAESYSRRDALAAWKGLKEGGGVGVGTLFRLAKSYGFDLAAQYRAEEEAEAGGAAPRAQGPSPEERERIERERRERELAQAEAASRARARWEAAATSGQSPYLVRKGVGAHGCRFEPGGALLVPMFDPDGALWNVQAIDRRGDKLFQAGARVKGTSYWIGDPAGRADLMLCEGFATGATLHEATGFPVLVAFNAGNLVEVARAILGRFVGPRWIVAADDDRGTEAKSGRNPGREAAQQAAKLLGALVLVPEGLPEGGTDFNDLAQARGLESVAALVHRLDEPSAPRASEAQAAPSAHAKAKDRGKGGAGRGGPPGGSGGGEDDGGGRSDPFLLTEEGVFYVSRDSGGAWVQRKVCAPLEVVGETRNFQGLGWGKLLRYVDRDGERREVVLSASLFAGDGVELRKSLADAGLWVSPIAGLRARLVEYLETRPCVARVRTVAATGWCGGAFVLPGETIGESDEAIVYHAPGGDPGLRLEQRGTLAGWRREVARRAEGNSRLLFAISMAFGAPLLALSGEKNGGFHLIGQSQDGKTSSLNAAGSVVSAPSYVRKWRATDNAIEGVAALHSDLPLLLDELHQCSPKLVGDVVYLLAEGQGKARGERAGGVRSILTWRTLFLSTGETGLSAYMQTADMRATAGQEMRIAEIPAAPEGGHGVFEHLHGEPTGEAFALRLRDAVASEYGTAGRAWLEWLVAHYDEAGAEVQRRIREVALDWTPVGAAGQVASVARRFALVGVAGEMATRAGITGWPKGAALAAARACFGAWVEVRGGAGRAEERELLRRLRAFLQANEHRFEWWERAHDDRAPKTLARAGFRKRFFDGEAIERDSDVHRPTGTDAPSALHAERMSVDFYVFIEAMRAEVMQDTEIRFAHRVLIERGILRTEKNGSTIRPYRRERLPGSDKGTLSSVYVITAEGRAHLEEALSAMGG